MNGKRARAIRRTFGVRHIHQTGIRRGQYRLFPRWLGGWYEDVIRKVESGS